MRLPSSVDRSDALLPSLGDPLRMVSLLLDRADEGLSAGRTAQARSDLSMADQELGPLRAGPLDGAAKAQADALATRLATLSGRAGPLALTAGQRPDTQPDGQLAYQTTL